MNKLLEVAAPPMCLVLAAVLAGAGVFALVCVGRAVSCARFNRALRSCVTPFDERESLATTVARESRSVVVDARHRFEARAQPAVDEPRSA